jgi:hypothetical protein
MWYKFGKYDTLLYLPLVFYGSFPAFASYANIVFSQQHTLELAFSSLLPAMKDDILISMG